MRTTYTTSRPPFAHDPQCLCEWHFVVRMWLKALATGRVAELARLLREKRPPCVGGG